MATKRKKSTKKAEAARKPKATRARRVTQTVTIDCGMDPIPPVYIDHGDTVEFSNACDEIRLIEMFDSSNSCRPVMFILLDPAVSVIVAPGPDADCHKTTCFYNVRDPNHPNKSEGKHNGANKIIIQS